MSIWGDIPSWIEALAIVFGITVWKRQITGQRDHDLALKLLVTLRKYTDEISWVRCPEIFTFEYPTFTTKELEDITTSFELDYKKIEYVYDKRWSKLEVARVNLVETITEAEIIFGAEKIKNIFLRIAAIENDVRDAIHNYVDSKNPYPYYLVNEEQIPKVNLAILYDKKEDDDIIRVRLSEPLNEIDNLLRPKLLGGNKYSAWLDKFF